MRTFAAVAPNGIPCYTVQPSDANTQVEGALVGPYVMRECPEKVEDGLLISNYFWKDGSWCSLPVKLFSYLEWDLKSEFWKDNRLISKVLAEKNNYINTSRFAANQSSFIFQSKSIAVDSLSRSDIDAVHGIVVLTNEMPDGWVGGWKAVDNTFVSIPNVSTWSLFYKAMVGQGSVNFAHAQQLKAQLVAATTIEEVEAIVW